MFVWRRKQQLLLLLLPLPTEEEELEGTLGGDEQGEETGAAMTTRSLSIRLLTDLFLFFSTGCGWMDGWMWMGTNSINGRDHLPLPNLSNPFASLLLLMVAHGPRRLGKQGLAP